VKQLGRNGFQRNHEFLVEVLMLSLLQHRNSSQINLLLHISCWGIVEVIILSYKHE
jgi:hypothetical protein